MLKRFLTGGFFILALAACQPQQQTLPTLESLPTAIPTTAVPTVDATIAPTVPRARPTLPPTFTPTATETETATPTPTLAITPTFFNPPVELPPGCETFLVDDASRSIRFNLGESPTVSWAAATGAIRYRLTLAELTGRILTDTIYIAETTYTFPGELFEQGRFYGWDVYPINEAGDQMCFIQGGELTPIVPR